MSETLVKPSSLSLWWMAIRPKTLGLAVSPVILATALVWRETSELARPEIPLVILLCAIAIQAGTNLFNDAEDHLNGTDDEQRLGPPRITALGWALPQHVSAAGLFAFLIALLGGMYLIQSGGWPIFFGGLAALWAGYLYSRGPFPISRSPFGEIVVIVFFGLFAVSGTLYLMTGNIPASAYLWGTIMGLPAGAVLMLNNIRDLDSDRKAGRQTLAIVLGDATARKFYAAMMIAPFVLIVVNVANDATEIGTLFGFAAFLFTMKTVRAVRKTPAGTSLNPLLARTVQGQTLLALTAAFGLAFVSI